ncbi:hypothetical protein NFI96_011092 [Prochilodus magdalenae]|nr:hypothetical protein NFI96_011092 [Prochilodus magdalenae]
MWYPPAPVFVPCYLEPYMRRASDVPTTVMWQMIPFDPQLYLAMNGMIGYRDCSLSVEHGKKFLLNKSVFDLVKVSYFLELTDPKLLGWYLSLQAEDRKLIQEEGGLLSFLQRHPALEVTRHIVHLKKQVLGNNLSLPTTDMSSNLKSRHPTFYGASQCLNCATRCHSGSKKCTRCRTSTQNSEENDFMSEEEKSLRLLPNNVKEELNLLKGKRHEASMSNLEKMDCIISTSNSSSARQVNCANRCRQVFDGCPLAQNCPDQQEIHSAKAQYLSELWADGMWNDGSDVTVFKDPSVQANFSLDMALEMQSHTQKSDQDQGHVVMDASTDFPTLSQETPPEYYSLNSTGLEHTSAQSSDATESGHSESLMATKGSTGLEHTSSQWSDATESGRSESLMATKGSPEVSTVDEPVENLAASGPESCTFPDSVSCDSSEWTDYTEDYQELSNEDELECEPKTDEYHSVIEGLSSSGALASDPGWSESGSGSKQHTSERTCAFEESFLSVGQCELNQKSTRPCQNCEEACVPCSVSKAVDATSDFRSCFTSTQATEIGQNTFLKPCRDIAVSTDSFTNCEQETQTVRMSASEKCTITEVRMSDLDALSEEFEHLKMMEEELKQLKDKRSSSGYAGGPGSTAQKSTCGCDAVQRAKLAELRLLALQFAMCQQHCWRHFYTSPLGETALQGTAAPPELLFQTLKILEGDYLKMKRKILAGVHLDDLEPLSVDTCHMTTETCYSPDMVIEAHLEGVAFKESAKSSSLDSEDQLDQTSQVLNLETLEGVFLRDSPTPGFLMYTQIHCLTLRLICAHLSNCVQDLNSSDAWFDAEEELGCDDQCFNEEKAGQSGTGGMKMEHKGSTSGNADQGSLLCVTCLPSNVTECDLLLWFEQYHASQVTITTFSTNRTAVVTVRSHSDAEKAVKEVNGQSIQGYTLHVEHIHRSSASSQGPIKAPCAEHFPAACTAGPTGEGQRTHESKNTSQGCRPPRCSLDRLINIHDKPTASGTCVPQHYATMGSFDTLMARLSERHPKVSRQKIVGALLELRAKHQGFLSGLPLRDIADMASDLLTQQSVTK